MSHLRAGRVGAGGDQLEADRRSTVRTFRADRLLVEDVIMILLQPH
jgi:hypothetical protein